MDYYKDKHTAEQYIKMAAEVNALAVINRLKPFLTKTTQILELGSGPGTDWSILNKSHHITGSDNSIVFLEHLRSNFRNGRFLELDARTLDTDETFDCIFSNKVLHHFKR